MSCSISLVKPVLNESSYGLILDRVVRDLNKETSKKAIRILEWIACSFRIMKVHEIQDGIVLHTRDMELNERTKLRDSKFLDLCKPLIEEGPNNTIDFVHYSAKEWVETLPCITLTKCKLQVHLGRIKRAILAISRSALPASFFVPQLLEISWVFHRP